MPDVSLVELSP